MPIFNRRRRMSGRTRDRRNSCPTPRTKSCGGRGNAATVDDIKGMEVQAPQTSCEGSG